MLHVQREGLLVNLYNSVSASRKLFFFVSSGIVFSHLVMQTFPASVRGRNVKKGHYFLIRQILQNKFVSPQEVMKNISTLMVLPWSNDSSTKKMKSFGSLRKWTESLLDLFQFVGINGFSVAEGQE